MYVAQLAHAVPLEIMSNSNFDPLTSTSLCVHLQPLPPAFLNLSSNSESCDVVDLNAQQEFPDDCVLTALCSVHASQLNLIFHLIAGCS